MKYLSISGSAIWHFNKSFTPCMTNDLITVLANLALTLSFIVAVIFGIAQVKTAARDRRERLTLETLRNFQTREFAELVQFIVTEEQFPMTREERNNLPADQTAMYIQYAQQME